MEWTGKEKHMGGIPRKIVFLAVGAFAKAVATILNTTSVHNADTLLRLVRSRPPGIPLLTVSNHMSTLDDPLIWGFKGFPSWDAKLARWLHTFPEGKVSQEDAPIRRLKWGTASLIVRAQVTPIVLPIIHCGLEKSAIEPVPWGLKLLAEKQSGTPTQPVCVLKSSSKSRVCGCASLSTYILQFNFVLVFLHVMPENFLLGRRPPFPLCNKNIKILIGEPLEFDIPKMRQMAISMSRDISCTSRGWPIISPHGLDEAAQNLLTNVVGSIIIVVIIMFGLNKKSRQGVALAG
ncbi:Tafazzin [Corchorus olitorius]|uniref:Tafazzin family protein n=1 Tax=Corchorus olitorius TaxID=93759 RepID=A0A1R3ILC1_9ROSI|nr:Tafazzin [Corchorus olitorius]